LYRVEKPVYYIADAEFTLNDIQTYRPDFADGSSPLIPPGTNIILEAQVVADKRLSPYVVWYAGKQRIGEGSLSNGSSQLLWKVPQQSGFHSIRVEVFPFNPGSQVSGRTQTIPGKIKELSLPISSKYEGRGYFAQNAETLIRWYQLRGDLHDTTAADGDLAAQNKTAPKWQPHISNYGLAVGPQDVYILPEVIFLPLRTGTSASPSGDTIGGISRGQILLRFAPVSEGVIFSGRFTRSRTSAVNDTAVPALELSWSGTELLLNVTAGDESYEERIPQTFSGGFITAVINVQFDADRLSAGLQLDSAQFKPGEHAVTLPEPLNGKGVFQIGGGSGVNSGARNSAASSPAAIISELGISSIPEQIVLAAETPAIPPEDTAPKDTGLQL
jgi:hypothetical protein